MQFYLRNRPQPESKARGETPLTSGTGSQIRYTYANIVGMGSKNATAKVRDLKPKKKCCRKDVRCIRCPVVVHRLRKLDVDGMNRKKLEKAIKKARVA
ncbi:hypothetical protein GCM10010528_26720 [Gordonia defluvii]|uniref:Uncharacterized protein n=2 Tax=Gordoniaceae TaxID=85026 RepID=A0ABP6LL33_9ACTN